jgi:hypothetical protein
MNKYMFRTTATMKEYNNRQWYITPDIIRTKYIDAENMREALEEYARSVSSKDYIDISANAIRTRKPMYIDTPEGPRQVGYVITGKIEMQRENGSWSTQYIDLWIDVDIISPADF